MLNEVCAVSAFDLMLTAASSIPSFHFQGNPSSNICSYSHFAQSHLLKVVFFLYLKELDEY